MPIIIPIGRAPRRKKASLWRVENRRQLRDHDRTPEFGLVNLAKIQAAGLMWAYLRCAHGVMGYGRNCSLCNPEAVSTLKGRWVKDFEGRGRSSLNARLTPTEQEVTLDGLTLDGAWTTVCLRHDRNGEPYYHTGEVGPAEKRSPEGSYTPEFEEYESGWRELVAHLHKTRVPRKVCTYTPRMFSVYESPEDAANLAALENRTRRSDGKMVYFDLSPQHREDWQPEVVHTSASGPAIDLMLNTKGWSELPYLRVDNRTQAEQWWWKLRNPMLPHPDSWPIYRVRGVHGPKFLRDFPFPRRFAFTFPTPPPPERVFSYAPGRGEAPKRKPIPRGTWTGPVFETQAPVKLNSTRITVCAPVKHKVFEDCEDWKEADALYRANRHAEREYDVPKVQYRRPKKKSRLAWGFYGDGHCENNENRKMPNGIDQIYPIVGKENYGDKLPNQG